MGKANGPGPHTRLRTLRLIRVVLVKVVQVNIVQGGS